MNRITIIPIGIFKTRYLHSILYASKALNYLCHDIQINELIVSFKGSIPFTNRWSGFDIVTGNGAIGGWDELAAE